MENTLGPFKTVFLLFLVFYTVDCSNRVCFCGDKPIACGEPPQVVNGVYEESPNGKTATLVCNSGFIPTPPTTINCGEDGEWSVSTAICQTISCGEPPEVPNGVYNESSDGKTATLVCNSGFIPTPPTTINCEEDGEWSVSTAICLMVSCGDPPRVLNGRYKERPNGKTATLMCRKGFIPTPPTIINCGEDGEWTEPSAICQTTSFSGTDFVMVFPRVTLNVGGRQDIRRIQMVAPEATVVNITSDFNAINLLVWVGTTAEVDIDTSVTLLKGKQVTNKVLRLKATTPFTVHGLCYRVKRREVGMDSYLVLPTEQLGTEYIIVTTNTTAQFAVAAVEDGTNIIIFYTDNTVLTRQKLNSHEVYTYFRRGSTVSLTGTFVMSNKPIAVFSGGYYSSIPSIDCSSRDTAITQMIPVRNWYKLCIIAPFFPDEEFLYEVIASKDRTNLDVTVGNTTTQKKIYRWCALQDLVTSNEAVVITSNKPILVVLFSVSKAVTGRVPGDGAMVQCIDPDKYLNIYTFFVNDLFDTHYVRIIIQDKFKSDLILNGDPVLSISVYSLSVTAPDGDMYTVLYVVVDPNVQYVLQTTSGARFGADAYGFFRAGQYAHNLGHFFH